MTDQNPKEITKEAQIVYQQDLDDIRFVKRQQWSITHYALLLYAALIAIKVIAGWNLPENTWEIHALIILAILNASYSIYLIIEMQCTLRRRRKRLWKIRDEFFEERSVELLFGKPNIPRERHEGFWYQVSIWGLKIFVSIIGGIATVWLLAIDLP